MIIDHICFAVKNLEEGIVFWESTFGYTPMTRMIENSRQQVKVIFLHKSGSLLIKLIEPFESNSSLVNFLKKGGGFHHICFKCAHLDEQLNDLTQKGMISLVPPQPGEAFNNHNIAFLLARNGLTVELIDTDEKAGKLEEE